MSSRQFTAADKASIDAYRFFMQVGISACLAEDIACFNNNSAQPQSCIHFLR